MIEIRWHSRGNLGAVTSARIFAEAALQLGWWSQAFPEYGAERSGAPIMCFNRVSKREIRLRCAIYDPDIVVVLDETLCQTAITQGLKSTGIVLMNTCWHPSQVAQQLDLAAKKILILDANAIAASCGCFRAGNLMPNTAMLGALLQLLGGKRLVEAGQARLAHWFRGEELIKNRNALLQGAQAGRKFAVPKRLNL